MAFSDELAELVRAQLQETPDYVEKKMFGGRAFMIRGHMCAGIIGDELMVRVGKDLYDDVLGRPHVRPMDFTGRPMTGFVCVEPEGVASDSGMADFVDLALQFNSTMPAK